MIAASPPDLARVERWFADGSLVRPGSPDIVDLIRALAEVCGVDGAANTPAAQALTAAIGAHDHVVFVLVDGLGSELLAEQSRGAGFLAGAVARRLHAVFPSTTSVALTSLTTATYPAEHGIPGWWTYLPEIDVEAEILPFVERFTKRSLIELGARPERVFELPSIFPRFRREQLVVTRGYIVDSTYSRYWSGGAASVGYDRIADGVDLALRHLASARAPSYTHLYINHLDSLCHQHGVHHPEVAALFRTIDRELARLAHGLRGRARLVLTADHGHIDAGEEHVLRDGDPLLAMLRCPPSGEPRVPLFHLRPGEGERFRAAFTEAHGSLFALLSLDEAAGLGLLGPVPLSDRARARFGDLLALAAGRETLRYERSGAKPHRNLGVHAGLTPAEIEVPLVLG